MKLKVLTLCTKNQTAQVRSSEEKEKEKLIERMMKEDEKKKADEAAQMRAEGKGENIVKRAKRMVIRRKIIERDRTGNQTEKWLERTIEKPDVIEFYERIKKNADEFKNNFVESRKIKHVRRITKIK